MNKTRWMLAAVTVMVLPASYLVLAQQPPAAGRGRGAGAPPQPMSFFVTSVGKGDGANLGGLAGADAHCQQLAAAAGRGSVTWHAYLSTQGPGAVNARDRIGKGPWYNASGAMVAMNVGQLHGDTIEEARIGNALGKQISLNEKKGITNGVGDMPNQHDMLTGSQPDGRAYTDAMDHTCNNWTSNSMGAAQLGHVDKQGGGNGSWNSAHPSRGCSQANLVSTGGAGLFYCFEVN
jgi:hypothetical protein